MISFVRFRGPRWFVWCTNSLAPPNFRMDWKWVSDCILEIITKFLRLNIKNKSLTTRLIATLIYEYVINSILEPNSQTKHLIWIQVKLRHYFVCLLQRYFNVFKNKNARHSDLLRVLTQVSYLELFRCSNDRYFFFYFVNDSTHFLIYIFLMIYFEGNGSERPPPTWHCPHHGHLDKTNGISTGHHHSVSRPLTSMEGNPTEVSKRFKSACAIQRIDLWVSTILLYSR